MPIGTHPKIAEDGTLTGRLVALLPAQGEPTIPVQVGVDEDDRPVVEMQANPAYLTQEDATLAAISNALATAGHPVGPEQLIRELGFTGPHELPAGQACVYAQIYVGDGAAEAARRAAIDAACAQFAP